MIDLETLVSILSAAKLVLELRDYVRKDRSTKRRGDVDKIR